MVVKKCGWMLVICCLSSCSVKYTTNDKQQYLESKNGPLLVVPEPLTRSNISGFYDLPTPEGNKKVSIVPPKERP